MHTPQPETFHAWQQELDKVQEVFLLPCHVVASRHISTELSIQGTYSRLQLSELIAPNKLVPAVVGSLAAQRMHLQHKFYTYIALPSHVHELAQHRTL